MTQNTAQIFSQPQAPVATPPPAPPPATLPPLQKPKSGGFGKAIFRFFITLIVLFAIAGVYYLGTQKNIFPHKAMPSPTIAIAPSVSPTITPTPDPTVNWSTYTNSKYAFSIKYPNNLSPQEVNSPYYYVEFKNASSSISATPSIGASLPQFVISAISETFTAKDIPAYNYMSSDYIAGLMAMKVGDTKTTSSGAIFTKMPDMTIAGQSAIVFQVSATGYKQERIYIKENGNYYMFSNYYQADSELSSFNLFFSTLKFSQ